MDPTGSGWVILAHPPHNNLPLFDGELGEREGGVALTNQLQLMILL